MKRKIELVMTILLILGLFMAQFQCANSPNINPDFSQVAFDKLADEVSNGKVPDISAITFKKEKESFIILDCRELGEYEISHIENARRVGFDTFNVSQIADIPKGAKIVTYCTVGKRSEKIGEKLLDAGYTDVQNLYGSILNWTNHGNPVVDSQGYETNKIHGFKKEMEFEKQTKTGQIVY